jgi:hypothetical protein
MSKKWPGGIITPTPATPTGPYENGTAPGIWTLSQQAYWLKQGLWPIAGNVAPRAINNGGDVTQGQYAYFNMASAGGAASFGSLLYDRSQFAGLSSATRGVFAGGSGSGVSNMEYITIMTTGNGTSFGNLSNQFFQFAGAANSTRGIWFLVNQTTMTSLIEYITIATTGNSTFFGNSTNLIRGMGAGANSTTALCALALIDGVGQVNTVQYVTIATTGNASTFGQLTVNSGYKVTGFSSSTRVFFAGGGGSTGSGFNTIAYFTVATTGNATYFGDLNNGLNAPASTSSSVYGYVMGGFGSSPYGITSSIQYITMTSSGNSSTWGQLTASQYDNEACSSAHGGL